MDKLKKRITQIDKDYRNGKTTKLEYKTQQYLIYRALIESTGAKTIDDDDDFSPQLKGTIKYHKDYTTVLLSNFDDSILEKVSKYFC